MENPASGAPRPTSNTTPEDRTQSVSNAEIAAESAAIYPDTNEGPPTPEQIAEEAYRLYLGRGGEDGRDLEDWLEAERRLSRNKPR